MLATLKGETKKAVLNDIVLTKLEIWDHKPLASKIAAIAFGSYKKRTHQILKVPAMLLNHLRPLFGLFIIVTVLGKEHLWR